MNVQQVIDEAREHLMSSQRDEWNELASNIDADDTTFELSYDPQGISRGAIIELGIEPMLVHSVSGRNITVRRAFKGGLAALHDASTLVKINPSILDLTLFRAVRDELQGLSAEGLYRVQTVTLAATTDMGYTLGLSNVLDVVRVTWNDYSDRNWITARGWVLERDNPSFTGDAIIFKAPLDPGRTVRVHCRTGFTAPTEVTDDLTTDCGLHSEASDIVVLGSALRAMAGREVTRNLFDAQGSPRRMEEVPAGAVAASPGVLRQIRQKRIAEEQLRLAKLYPEGGV